MSAREVRVRERGVSPASDPAEDVVRWASQVLNTPVEQLRMQYGTHEVETALR